jgi:hypothetical protein
MNLISIIMLSFVVTSCNNFGARLTIYDDDDKPSCLAQQKDPRNITNPKVTQLIDTSIKQPYHSPYSLWDQDTVRRNPNLKQALKEYSEGKRGMSVRHLTLSNKAPQTIHYELINKGFKHSRVPLAVNANETKKKSYWCKDGSTTNTKLSKRLVYMDTYSHTDGGLVRVKPHGIPDPRNPRPQPHAAKSVLLNTKAPYDSSWQNEAFKVSEEGYPVPKAPTKDAGLKSHDARIKQDLINAGEDIFSYWVNGVMDRAHINLKVDFSHCN